MADERMKRSTRSATRKMLKPQGEWGHLNQEADVKAEALHAGQNVGKQPPRCWPVCAVTHPPGESNSATFSKLESPHVTVDFTCQLDRMVPSPLSHDTEVVKVCFQM